MVILIIDHLINVIQLEKEMATHSSILAWRIPMDRGAWWVAVHGVTESQKRLTRLTMWMRLTMKIANFMRQKK